MKLAKYFPLIVIVLIGLFGIYWFNFNRPIQLSIMMGVVVAYLSWGIVNHAIKKDLHLKIIYEYLILGFLAILLFATVIYST
jgi:hypothetical protein